MITRHPFTPQLNCSALDKAGHGSFPVHRRALKEIISRLKCSHIDFHAIGTRVRYFRGNTSSGKVNNADRFGMDGLGRTDQKFVGRRIGEALNDRSVLA